MQLCPISGWNADECGCRDGTHEYIQRIESEIKRLSDRVEDADSVIARYANPTNWTHNSSFTDLDDPEKRLWKDLWNVDSEDGFERAKTYCNAHLEGEVVVKHATNFKEMWMTPEEYYVVDEPELWAAVTESVAAEIWDFLIPGEDMGVLIRQKIKMGIVEGLQIARTSKSDPSRNS